MGNKIQKIYIGDQLVWPGWIGDLSKWAISQTSSALSSNWYGGVYFNNDGTKIYLTQYGNGGKIHEGTLSTPYDISTISITNSLSVQYPEDIHFSGDGTKMFIVKSDTSPYRILRYTLSTAWSISTATQDQYIDRGSSNADRGLYITPDGKNIYIGTRSGSSDGLDKYTLSTAWDLSTAGTVESISNSIGGISIRFGDDGKLLFTSTEGISTIRYYKLSTAYDISTITEQGTLNIAGATRAGGMWFSKDGTMCVIAGGGNGTNYVTKYMLTYNPNYIELVNSSVSDITSKGWIYKFSTPSFDSGGAYSTSGNKVFIGKVVDLSNATKVKITANARIVTGGYYGDVRTSIMNENESNYYYGYAGVQSCHSAYGMIRILMNNGQKSILNGSNTTGEYQHIFEVNLTTGATTYTITGPNSTTYTLTSSEISTVKGYTLVGAGYEAAGSGVGSNGHHLKDILVEVS